MPLNETGSVTMVTGVFVLLTGAFLLFDPALVISGNLLVVAGFVFFLRTNTLNLLSLDKIQGTSFFILGLAMMLFKYALFGIILELLGLFLLFKSSLPSFRNLLYSLVFRKTLKLK